MLALAMFWAAGPAAAFCGTYVGDGASTLTNRASQIVIAREQGWTTLTMFNDYQGDLANFGLVVPIPDGVTSEDVRLSSRDLLEKLEGYSQPRVVSYTCDDWYGVSEEARAAAGNQAWSGSGGGCGGGINYGARPPADDSGLAADTSGVVIEDQFDLGEYTAWIVSAEGGDGLSSWLNGQGFTIDAATGEVLGDYVEAGSHFLALRVDLDRLDDGDQWLSPLQVTYYAPDAWTLPLRLGAANSAGVQDLVLYTLTAQDAGRVGIANYPETPAPAAECLLDLGDAPLADWYEQQFEAATGLPARPEDLDGRTGMAWVTEYGWSAGKCDPCTSAGPLQLEEMAALGFQGGAYGSYFTRLHLRYTPDAMRQDIVLHESGLTANTQVRYVQHAWELESDLPRCDGTVPDAPGTCYSSEYWARKAQEGVAGTEVLADEDDDDGCDGVLAMLLLPLGLAWRRRR
ncbi:MAG: DUF2330 domain-containing protein [Myxococcota bacterium]